MQIHWGALRESPVSKAVASGRDLFQSSWAHLLFDIIPKTQLLELVAPCLPHCLEVVGEVAPPETAVVKERVQSFVQLQLLSLAGEGLIWSVNVVQLITDKLHDGGNVPRRHHLRYRWIRVYRSLRRMRMWVRWTCHHPQPCFHSQT